MPNDEFGKSPETSPSQDVPPLPATEGVKPNGEAISEPTPPDAPIPRRARTKKPPSSTPPEKDVKADDEPGEDGEVGGEPIDIRPGSGPEGEPTAEDLDADAAEFARLRRDLPNVEGAAATGIVSIAVAKIPPRNEFFRTSKTFQAAVDIVVDSVGLDQKFYAVHPAMAEALRSIGIAFATHSLYLIMTSKGAIRVIPVRCSDADGARNDYAATKEIALREARDIWLRIYTDRENGCYRRYPAGAERFPEPVFPPLTDAKIFRLCFRERGCLIDTPDHPRFIEWAALKAKDQ